MPSVRRSRTNVFAGGQTTPSNVGRNNLPFRTNAWTRAQDDTKLFGLHTGITFPGSIIRTPQPIYLGAMPTRYLTLRGNPWFMAPGWRQFRRFIDIEYRLGGKQQPTPYVNPWDERYGTIGSYGTRYLPVLDGTNQSGGQSMI